MGASPVLLVVALVGCPASNEQRVPEVAVFGARCQAHRLCAAAEPRPCVSAGESIFVDDLARRADELVGTHVIVRGPLRLLRTSCTAAACDRGLCCNECSGVVVIGELDREYVVLRHRRCEGDDTGICCPLVTDGREVLASGTLVARDPMQDGVPLSRPAPRLGGFVLTESTDSDPANAVAARVCALDDAAR